MQVEVQTRTTSEPVETIPLGTDAIVPESATQKPASEGEPILSQPSVQVTIPSEVEQMLRQSAYEAAKRTADNLVDSPEERRRKAEQRKDEELKRELAELSEEAAQRRAEELKA